MRSRLLFVSYSRHDREFVSKVCELLRVGGTQVQQDKDIIQLGKQWRLVLAEKVQECDCVLLFWSANSAVSQAVKEEYSTAILSRKDIAPVLLDDTPLEKPLREYQRVDCRSFVMAKPRPQAVETHSEVSPGKPHDSRNPDGSPTRVHLVVRELPDASEKRLVETFKRRLVAGPGDMNGEDMT